MKYVAPKAAVVDVEVLNVLLASEEETTCENELPIEFDC